MSFGITNLTANRNYVDISSINEVTKQIFTKADEKTFDYSKADLTKFRRPELGLDLYSGRTNIETSKQIAVRNAGLDINLNENFIANIQYLNTQAAMTTQKTTKNVEGKLIAPVAEGEAAQQREVAPLPKSVELFNTANLNKDKRGSNPFSFFAPANNSAKEQKEEQINIFA